MIIIKQQRKNKQIILSKKDDVSESKEKQNKTKKFQSWLLGSLG